MQRPVQPSREPGNVLLVDDNSHGLVARKAILEELGLTVNTATNGVDALDLFGREDYHVLVTDYKMPRMDGIELISRVRALKPQVKVILLSGFVEPLGLTEESTGADEVIPKSAGEVGMLVRSITRMLNRPYKKPPASVRAPARAKATNLQS
jgi:CheY-like chemotaxis protein